MAPVKAIIAEVYLRLNSCFTCLDSAACISLSEISVLPLPLTKFSIERGRDGENNAQKFVFVLNKILT